MPSPLRGVASIAVILALGTGVCACTTSYLHIADNFGRGARQDLVAQIADPEARYEGKPAPGSSGRRIGLALDRYNNNAVIPPAVAVTTAMTTTAVQ
jgi:hypothetical protein